MTSTPTPTAPITAPSNEEPLAGLKVLDLTWVVAGPVIGRALADFGATVIRVESSTRVETARHMQPFYGGKPGTENSGLYGTWNAGKLGMTVDLQDERGQRLVRELADQSDVVLESFSPGLVKRWGLDYETLTADRDDLIMLSTAIMGQTGPYAKLAGYGNVGAALSGFQDIVGWPDRPAFGPFGPYTDYVGPRFALVTLLAALEHRRQTGQGCYIDVSQVEAGVYLQAPEMADNDLTRRVVHRVGNDDREMSPHGVFRCRTENGQDRFTAIAVRSTAEWKTLARIIRRSDLADDPTLDSAEGRRARADEIGEAITAWTSGRLAHHVEDELQQAGIPAHVSASSADFCADPQLAYRNHLVRLPHPLHGEAVVEGPRYLLSDTPGVVRRAAPTFGQDNQYVITHILGHSDEEFRDLEKAGVLR